ncbi:MAG: DUF4387 domain-containing protein [Armatimonadetes bacterium]|nr:DUF4387 domain-containing protein [Armatimonadota bacterium]
MTTRIRDIATVVRSKNAKAFKLTFDIFFPTPQIYRRVKMSGALTPEVFARLYDAPVLAFTWFDPGLALKATIRRPVPVGAVGDPDVFGCQQHAPLLDLELPWDDTDPEATPR